MKNYLINNFEPARLMNVFDELPLWSAPFGLKLLDAVEYKANLTAIDIGFGSGFPMTELAMRLGNSSVVYGIDPWKEAIERTKEKIDYYGIRNIRIIEGVAESIRLAFMDSWIELLPADRVDEIFDKVESNLNEYARHSGGIQLSIPFVLIEITKK